MTALRVHRKSSPGDDPRIIVKLLKVTSPPKAHEGQGLQHKQKGRKVVQVIKVKKVKDKLKELGRSREVSKA